ncbi:MAG: phospholipase D family protein [Xanthomonadaceae bacterium]|nr:phospholipase D family protein [Xanthomonadaceae bacterium]
MLYVILVLLALVVLGWIFTDQLMPSAYGAQGRALPVQPGQTPLDRAIEPQLAAHPGESGAVMVSDGLDAFALRAATLRAAGRSLDAQYYIWHDDITGRLLGREIWMAAERGVRIRLILDDMDTAGKDHALAALDAHPLIEIRLYNPARNRSGPKRVLEMIVRALHINHRMHNKSWIADNRVAIVGGRNIGEEYFDASTEANFHDLDVVLAGPAVDQASAIFDRFWNSEAVIPVSALTQESEADIERFIANVNVESQREDAKVYLERVARDVPVQSYFDGTMKSHWSPNMAVMSDPPLKWEKETRNEWLVEHIAKQMGSTQKQALLISPYFVPGDSFTQKLVSGVASGKEIGVITNSLAANDVLAVHSGYMRYRKPLLAGGVTLHELRAQPGVTTDRSLLGSSGASLHTKAYVLDGSKGFIGSFNLDPRSMKLNTEMGLLFEQPGLAEELAGEYRHLASPALSYQVKLDERGKLVWLDQRTTPPTELHKEPDSKAWQRAAVKVLSWLPIQSQL